MSRTPARARKKRLRFSIALYSSLLWLYPAAFRRAYGPQMVQVFRDSCRLAEQERGLPGIISLWFATLADLLRSALAEHLAEGTIMSRPFYIRVSGLLTLGGAALALWLNFGLIDAMLGVPPVDAMTVIIACWTLGLAGLLLAQRGWIGRFSASLPLLALGALLAVYIIADLQIAPLESIVENILYRLAALGWGFSQADGLITGMALVACGVVTLKERLLARWNAVPLILGLWTVYDNLTVSYWADASPIVGIGSLRISLVPFLSLICNFCLWGCLGYALWAKPRPKPAVPAVQAQSSAG